MALGLGEGGEQNAPLGRAVIGGLIFATGAINRDLGSTLEISQGLSESDQIITSPPPGLVDGTVVIIAKPT